MKKYSQTISSSTAFLFLFNTKFNIEIHSFSFSLHKTLFHLYQHIWQTFINDFLSSMISLLERLMRITIHLFSFIQPLISSFVYLHKYFKTDLFFSAPSNRSYPLFQRETHSNIRAFSFSIPLISLRHSKFFYFS